MRSAFVLSAIAAMAFAQGTADDAAWDAEATTSEATEDSWGTSEDTTWDMDTADSGDASGDWGSEETTNDWDDDWSDMEGGDWSSEDKDEWDDWADDMMEEAEEWWTGLLEELASMAFDELENLVCSDTMGIKEIEEMCMDSDKHKEDMLEMIGDLDEDDLEMFAEEIEKQWEDAWDFIYGGAMQTATFTAVTVTAIAAIYI